MFPAPALQKKKNPLRKKRHQASAVTKAMEKRAIKRTSDRSKIVIFFEFKHHSTVSAVKFQPQRLSYLMTRS